MKIDRQKLACWISQIQEDTPNIRSGELADRLASLLEAHPSSVNPYGVARPGRFSYSTVGYAVMSPLGEKYRIGRIEISDARNESGYPVEEGSYWIPHSHASQFEDFIDSIETPLPILIQMGSASWCERECAEDLGFSDPEDMKKNASEFWERKRKSQEGNPED